MSQWPGFQVLKVFRVFQVSKVMTSNYWINIDGPVVRQKVEEKTLLELQSLGNI